MLFSLPAAVLFLYASWKIITEQLIAFRVHTKEDEICAEQ